MKCRIPRTGMIKARYMIYFMLILRTEYVYNKALTMVSMYHK